MTSPKPKPSQDNYLFAMRGCGTGATAITHAPYVKHIQAKEQLVEQLVEANKASFVYQLLTLRCQQEIGIGLTNL